MRQPGYYWVKWDNKWFIAELDSINDWHIPGILSIFSTDDLQEIDERRIERQPIVDNSKHDISLQQKKN